LKPEIADALDTIDPNDEEEKDGPSPRQVNPTGQRRRKKRPQQQQQQQQIEDDVEVATEAAVNGEVDVRPVPSSRRNVFTSKFIPRVKPVGNLENVKAIELDLDPEEPEEEKAEPASPAPPPPPASSSPPPQPSPAPVEETVAQEKSSEDEPEEEPRSPQKNQRFRFPRPPLNGGEGAASPKTARFQRPPVRRRKPGSEPEKKDEPVVEEVSAKPAAAAATSEEDKMIAELGEEMIKSLLSAAGDTDSPNAPSDSSSPDGEFKTDL